MNAPQIDEDLVQLRLAGASGSADVAAQALARSFDLPVQTAHQLVAGGGIIADRMPRSRARAALPLLAALGLRLVIEAPEAEAAPERYDLSIRLTNGYHAARLIRTLHRLVGPAGLSSQWFDGPSGMVLQGLTRARVDWLAAALRPLSGVQVVASPVTSARHDLFCTIETDAMDMAALTRHLSLMGVAIGGFGDAIASGLDQRTLDHVLARFGQCGVFGINQDFMRFDLLVSGPGSLSTSEFTDFIITRTGATPNMVRRISRHAPIRIESCLTRSAAQAFIGDYATIGLPAFARLIRN